MRYLKTAGGRLRCRSTQMSTRYDSDHKHDTRRLSCHRGFAIDRLVKQPRTPVLDTESIPPEEVPSWRTIPRNSGVQIAGNGTKRSGETSLAYIVSRCSNMNKVSNLDVAQPGSH
jgi:hypothetical protein